jgi:DNA-binding LacI/PurR family transcriptional regulator
MEDVARAAGVHQTTVSRALRNDRRLPEATRQRIKALAEQMGYRPNPLLSALGANLRRRRMGEFSATLAYLVRADTPAERRREHVAGALQAATTQGYRLEEFVVGEAGMSPDRLDEVLLARNVQGVVIAPLPAPRGSFDLRWEKFCAVSIELTFIRPLFDRVVHDAYTGMRTAMGACRDRGYRRPGLVLTEGGNERTEGLNMAGFLLEQQGSAMDDRLAPLILKDWAVERFASWYDENRPDVIITSNALLETINGWLGARGVKPGAEIGLVNLNARPDQPFSGIQQEWDAIGSIAVQLLIDKINRNDRGAPSLFRTILTPGRWLGGTTLPNRV